MCSARPAAARTAPLPRPRAPPSGRLAGRRGAAAVSGARPVEEAAARPGPPSARVAGQRPGQRRAARGPGDGRRTAAGAPPRPPRAGPRLRDRHDAVDEADHEHRVPLQALGGVHRRERHALHGGRVLGVGPLGQVRDEAGEVQRRAARRPGPRRGRPARPGDCQRSRAVPPGGRPVLDPAGEASTSRTGGHQGAGLVATGGARRAAAAPPRGSRAARRTARRP